MMTIKKLAKICGVSEGTVDRALHNRPGIGESTRQRILETAKRENYVPNRVAQNLANGRTMTIGLVCFDLHNSLFAALAEAVETAAKKNGYFLTLVLTGGELTKEMDGIQHLSEMKVDGMIIFPVGKGEWYNRYLLGLSIPVVSVYNRISPMFPYVGVDDYSAMRDAVHAIAGKGYERILFSTVHFRERQERDINMYALEQRRAGYEQGIADLGLKYGPCYIEGRDFSSSLAPYLRDNDVRTAVLCICDDYAFDLIKYCRENGISVPSDLGIMGYDNVDFLQYMNPRPATIDYNVRLLGETLFHVLLSRLQGEQTSQDILLDYTIVDGETL